jgi:glyoxylase-like metal-dependent hydrolase (beta-lactamase superfamily II)
MKKAGFVAVVVGLLLGPAPSGYAHDGSGPPGSEYEGQAFEFTQIRDGIYHARGTGALAVGCNGAVVVNEHDVLVVDSYMTPAAGWALKRELKRITDKPVRFVVNTHFHFDHAHGNQVFGPEVEIVAHEFTRDVIARGGSMRGRAYEGFVDSAPARIAELTRQIESEVDAAKLRELEKRRAELEAFKLATDAVVPTPPTLTLSERLTLHRGEREIHMLFLGRGHTGGDVVVHLPKEKVLITGDLVVECLPYMGDGYLAEWADTLERVKGLPFEWILPGHGAAYRDRDRITHLQAYLRDLWGKASDAFDRGVAAEQAAQQIDMTAHAGGLTCIDGPGVHPHAVLRVYDLLSDAE